jgi:hypothetical protein
MKRWQKTAIAVAVPLVVLLAAYSVMYADTNQLADDVEVLLEGNPDGRDRRLLWLEGFS